MERAEDGRVKRIEESPVACVLRGFLFSEISRYPVATPRAGITHDNQNANIDEFIQKIDFEGWTLTKSALRVPHYERARRMLLKFVAENHLSLRDETEFSLIADNFDPDDSSLISHDALPNLKILPQALIFGPNASGKSNVLGAFSRMCSIIANSHMNSQPESGIRYRPFALDEQYLQKPTKFEADFIVDNARYTYGFAFNERKIVSEWLFAYPTGRAVTLFVRTGQDFRFGRKLKGRNQVISDLTRKNSLFVSAAAQNDHDEILPIYRFFSNIEINSQISVGGSTVAASFADGVDPRIINFLSTIGSGVVAARKLEEEVSDLQRELNAGIAILLEKTFGKGFSNPPDPDKRVAIELAHEAKDGSQVYFEIDRESSGTRRILVMLAPIFQALDKGGLVFVDEIDASLHTQVCELVIALFSNKEYNKSGAQLIATAHDTNLLASEFLRKDQIWLCEKRSAGNTDLFPLTDYKVRSTDNFERGYLQGRFGALPFSGSVKTLMGERNFSDK